MFQIRLWRLFYFSGSFPGIPALRGYFFGVILILSMGTKVRSTSVPGSTRVFVSLIEPPSFFTALSASLASSSTFPDLYGRNLPPSFTNGRQYSDKVERFATALDTQRSNCSLYSLFRPKSSALPWTAVIHGV